MKVRTLIAAGAFALASAAAHSAEFINVLTGGTSGVYYPLGVALTNNIGKSLPAAKTSVQATKASAENLNLLQAGRGEVAFTLGDIAQTVGDIADRTGDGMGGQPGKEKTHGYCHENCCGYNGAGNAAYRFYLLPAAFHQFYGNSIDFGIDGRHLSYVAELTVDKLEVRRHLPLDLLQPFQDIAMSFL